MAQMDGAVRYCFWEICSKKYTALQGREEGESVVELR